MGYLNRDWVHLRYMKQLILVLAVIVGPGASSDLLACSCGLDVFRSERTKVKDAKKGASAVFVGKLVRLTEPKKPDGSLTGEVIAEFEVDRAWKGVRSSKITVYTTNICCICGFPFHEGATYLVYAAGEKKLYTNICTRTVSIGVGSKSEDEEHLGKAIVVVAEQKKLWIKADQ